MVSTYLLNDMLFAFNVMGKMEYELTDGSTFICEEMDDKYKVSYVLSICGCKSVFCSATEEDLEVAIAKVLDFVSKARVNEVKL